MGNAAQRRKREKNEEKEERKKILFVGSKWYGKKFILSASHRKALGQ